MTALLEDDASANAHRPVQLEVELCGMLAALRLTLLLLGLLGQVCAVAVVALLIDIADVGNTLRVSQFDVVLTREVRGDDHFTDILL